MEKRRGRRPGARAVRRRALRFPRAISSCGSSSTKRSKHKKSNAQAARIAASSFLSCAAVARMARPARSAACPCGGAGLAREREARRLRRRSIARCSPACSATSAASRRTGDYLGARGIKFPCLPRLGAAAKAAEMAHGGRADRDHAPVRAQRRGASNRNGSSSSPRIWRRSTISIRTGRRPAGQVVAFESVDVYGLIVVSRRRVSYGPWRRRRRAKSSSAARWWTATRSSTRRSCARTARSCGMSRRSSTSRAGTTSWWIDVGDVCLLRWHPAGGDLEPRGVRALAHGGRAHPPRGCCS